MNKIFNLKKYFKKAFYESGTGYSTRLSRAWSNCYKQKCDEGKSPNDAWNGCLEEYQTSNTLKNKGQWALDYISVDSDGKNPYQDAKTPAAQKIIGKKK